MSLLDIFRRSKPSQPLSVGSLAAVTPESVFRTAQAFARLPDCGGLDRLEGLDVLVGIIGRQKDLGDPNRIVQALAVRLARRLSIENYLHNHPEVHDEAIDSPLFVAGMPRAGTTLVQTLLALDPLSKYLSVWEMSATCPPPELFGVADPRIFECQRALDEWKKHNPALNEAHAVDAGRPQECQEVLAMDFKSTTFSVVWELPEYTEWLRKCDMTTAYRFHREVLKLLQSRNPGGRWVLKAPMHSMCLDTIQQVHNAPRFVLCHRDPVAVVASTSSTTGHVRSAASKPVDPKQIGREVLSRLSDYVEAIDHARRSIPEKDIYDVRYPDLVADPIGTIRAIYDRFGLEVNDAHRRRMAAWLSSSGGRPGQHRYSIDQFGISAALVRAQFSRYIEDHRLAVD
jgi:hypothetical protein